MTIALTVEIDGARRLFAAGDFPLSMGGAACHVALPGLTDEGPVAYLGHDQGDLFIQPAEGAAGNDRMTCNGVPLIASRWLSDGDEIAVHGHRLRCGIAADGGLLKLEKPADRETVRSGPDPAPRPARAITPVDFHPRWQAPPRRIGVGVRPRTLAATALIAALAVGAWFVLTARAIRVETTPEADSISIRGGWLTPRVGGTFLLRPGSYTVIAALEGYRSLSVPLAVNTETPAVVSYALEPLGGLLSINSRPVPGDIAIDGVAVGTTPASGIEVAAGEHTVEIRAPLYLPYQTTVHFEPGDPPRELSVELVPNWAPVTVATTPSGARVSVDGITIGSTPLKAKIEAGDRILEIRLAGYKAATHRLHVVAGDAVHFGPVELIPEDGVLAVVSEPTGASVTVDGVFRGTTPLELDLAPGGPYDVAVSAAAHATFTTELKISSGRRTEVRAVLEMQTGEVTVASEPRGAEVLVDGEPAGLTDRTLELDARAHEIEIRLDGYEPHRTNLVPEPGNPQAVHVVLRETGPAGLPPTIQSPQGAELILIGPGRFTMGAPRREPGRRADEVLREVEITRPFYVAVREVTNEEFRAFQSAHLSGSVGNLNLEIDHHPVVNVTWDDAARYCNWLSEQAGLPPVYVERRGSMVARTPFPIGFRLPTEAEWAWVARYPDSAGARKYVWGDALPVPAGVANFGDASAASVLGSALPGYRDGFPGTAPAGSFEANPLGIYNLGGNVAEWVNDLYAVLPTTSGEVQHDPTGPSEGAYHVIRGASWMKTNVTELRLSSRNHGDQARPDLGFRIARSAEATGGDR